MNDAPSLAERYIKLAQSNGNYGRVRLAIKSALIRHKNEMERGYALLEDHLV